MTILEEANPTPRLLGKRLRVGGGGGGGALVPLGETDGGGRDHKGPWWCCKLTGLSKRPHFSLARSLALTLSCSQSLSLFFFTLAHTQPVPRQENYKATSTHTHACTCTHTYCAHLQTSAQMHTHTQHTCAPIHMHAHTHTHTIHKSSLSPSTLLFPTLLPITWSCVNYEASLAESV